MGEITMITTADTDVHVVEGDVDMVRLKVKRNDWIATTDGRFVSCDKVVCVWKPTQSELEGFLESM